MPDQAVARLRNSYRYELISAGLDRVRTVIDQFTDGLAVILLEESRAPVRWSEFPIVGNSARGNSHNSERKHSRPRLPMPR